MQFLVQQNSELGKTFLRHASNRCAGVVRRGGGAAGGHKPARPAPGSRPRLYGLIRARRSCKGVLWIGGETSKTL